MQLKGRISTLERLILFLLVVALFLLQVYVTVVLAGGLLVGLGFLATIVFACLALSGFVLASSLSWRLKPIGALIFGLLALGLWYAGTDSQLISPLWGSTIDPFAYAMILSGAILGITLTLSVRFASSLARF